MRQFYFVLEKGVAMPHQLSWSHILSILPIDDVDKINYYIKIAEEQNLSYRNLRLKIKNKEYERLDESTKEKLKEKEELKLPDLVKNPIQIKNTSGNNEISEKVLQKLILEDIPSFLKELGNRYSVTTLKYMRMFYLLIEKVQPLADQLTWFYYCELLFIKYNIYYF